MSKLVTIYGGSGFVGRQIARQMARRGWRVRVAVRRPDEALFVRTYGAVGQVVPVLCNIRDDKSVLAAMTGADAVMNCVGILVNEGPNRFDPVHNEGAARIARLSAEAGIPRMVHLSAIGADADSPSEYARTKALGEAAILEARPDAVILRPSVIFGPGDGLYNKFGALSRFGPIMAIAGGKTRFQPVFVDDVAHAAAKALEGQAEPGIYELGGPEVMTTREMVRQVLQQTERRRLVMNMPFWVAGIVAGMLDLTQFVTFGLFTNRILTRDQVKMLRSDNVVAEDARTLADLGIQPTATGAVIDEYLWPYRVAGQYQAITNSAKNLRQS